MISDGAWAGERAVVVGGGPSLKDFNWQSLRGIGRIIVVNRAMFDVPWADVMLSEDERFFRRFAARDEYKAFRGIKIFACPDDSFVSEIHAIDPSVTIMQSCPKSKGWPKSLKDGLSTSSNSMVPAISLADILGAEPLYLLGVDCNNKGPANYHSGDYPADWAVGSGQLASYRSDFEHWVAPKMRNKKIVNCNVNSGVTCWPRLSFEDCFGARQVH